MTEEEKENDLLEELEENEEIEEFAPPEEENEAKILNTTNIIGVILGIFLLIFIIVFVALNIGGKGKKKEVSSELDKAGTKTVFDFKETKTPEPVSVEYVSGVPVQENYEAETHKEESDIDAALNSLPENIRGPVQGEVGKAPVSPVGSSSSSRSSDRPDTRNSRSPRKIEGLSGLNYSSAQQGKDLVNQIFGGNLTGTSGQKMNRDEFISNQMDRTKALQEQYYGSETTNNYYGNQKDEFFNESRGNSGNGTFLSRASLWDGTIISGALITAINTDNPGIVMARVTENVYSSQDHSYLLIPEGSVLMATYNSSVEFGQNSVQVAWNLLIRPDNYRIQLGNMNGVNSQGASGYKGKGSNHPFATLKALGLVAVYSLIQTEVSNDIQSQKNEYLQNAMTDVYSEASKLGNKIVDRALDIKPTIKIKEGTEIKLITNTPLELPPVDMVQPTEKYVRTRK
ncbi:MAG: conjugal transfer protein TrbI [Treponema sp.]|nr:conjugal transfer protein TrbI [Treponema sp.]